MPIIEEADRQYLVTRFNETLKEPVTIRLFTETPKRSLLFVPGQPQQQQANEVPKLVQDLLAEFVTTSPKLKLEVLDVNNGGAEEAQRLGVDHLPTIFFGSDTGARVKFTGAPVGNEFGTVIEAVEALSNNEPHIAPDIIEAAKANISEPVSLKVFVTPTCPHCPRMARAAHAFAMAHGQITAEVVEVEEFPDIAQHYGVMGVPKIVINDTTEFMGAVPDRMFLNAILETIGKTPVEPPEESATQ
jgi:glutaredoxin-like protein